MRFTRPLSAVVLAGSLALATGCASEPPPVSDKVQAYYDENKGKIGPSETEAPLTFAAYGDSITEANSPNYVGGQIGDGSWVYHAVAAGPQFVGGWADGGAPTTSMVKNAAPVSADALVILAGTNDLGRRPIEESQANIEAIAATVGAPRVVVSAVPPLNKAPHLATEYNAAMQAFVVSKGWQWVDPMTEVRAGDVWAEGMTSDGTHPTPAAARLIGETISRALLAG